MVTSLNRFADGATSSHTLTFFRKDLARAFLALYCWCPFAAMTELIGGLNLEVPEAAPSQEESERVFGLLEARFNLSNKVTKRIVNNLKFQTLEEFAKFPKEMFGDAIINPCELRDDAPINLVRLTLAHESVVKALKIKGNISMTKTELDILLPAETLETLRKKFHKRYHLVFEPDADVPDKLGPRLFKEVEKRELHVRDIWTVQTLASRQKIMRTKHEVAPGLTWEAEPDDETFTGTRSASNYLRLLDAYMQALARAGVDPLPGVPQQESLTTASIEVVMMPYDLDMRYTFRERRQTGQHFRQHAPGPETFVRARQRGETPVAATSAAVFVALPVPDAQTVAALVAQRQTRLLPSHPFAHTTAPPPEPHRRGGGRQSSKNPARSSQAMPF